MQASSSTDMEVDAVSKDGNNRLGQRFIRSHYTVLLFQGWTLEWCATLMAAKYTLMDEGGFAFNWEMDRRHRWNSKS